MPTNLSNLENLDELIGSAKNHRGVIKVGTPRCFVWLRAESRFFSRTLGS